MAGGEVQRRLKRGLAVAKHAYICVTKHYKQWQSCKSFDIYDMDRTHIFIYSSGPCICMAG